MKKRQLFCITYAGGSAAFFRGLIKQLENEIECHALEYSGHGIRRSEPFYKNFEELLLDTAAQIQKQRNPQMDYLLFGYSMGSYVAYELATRYLSDDPPIHVFLAAHEPPHLPFRGRNYAELNDQEFVKVMMDFGGMDERIVKNQRFLDIFLPPLRADYRYLHEYEWNREHKKIPCDITVFYSPKDTRKEDIEQWDQHTEGTATLKAFDGNHFFLTEHEAEIAEEISSIR